MYHGLNIAKIYCILQSQWLREYIEFNTNFGTLADNELEKNLYKSMNNDVFGKIIENVCIDIRFVTHWDERYGAKSMKAKPKF